MSFKAANVGAYYVARDSSSVCPHKHRSLKAAQRCAGRLNAGINAAYQRYLKRCRKALNTGYNHA